jgi:hypothetical protein
MIMSVRESKGANRPKPRIRKPPLRLGPMSDASWPLGGQVPLPAPATEVEGSVLGRVQPQKMSLPAFMHASGRHSQIDSYM